MAEILIIDDDEMICETLADLLSSTGNTINYALSLEEGIGKLSETVDLVLLDVNLPDGNGIDAISSFRNGLSNPEIIIITGEGDPKGAELAIKGGAWDYIQKPLSFKSIHLALNRVMQYRKEKSAHRNSRHLIRHGIVGESPAIRSCIEFVGRAADVDTNVLITGETGTGKELFSRAIHVNSHRATRPFVVVDCAALPETLLESTLFGHIKGAYTGADASREGLIRQADGGTLFLDEVGEMPVSVQGAFLRVLQEHRFRPVGSDQEIHSDFRLVAATNRNLGRLCEAGRFRRDLFYRLQSMRLNMPPLRDRVEDILSLSTHYINGFSARYGLCTKALSPEFMETVSGYEWPGNVRELINALEQAVSISGGERELFPVHLPEHVRAHVIRSKVSRCKDAVRNTGDTVHAAPGASGHPLNPFPPLRRRVEDAEQRYLRDLVAHAGGDIGKICKIAGLSRANVYKKLKKYGIERKF